MTYEEWKCLFSYHMIKFFEEVNMNQEQWFRTVQGELSSWPEFVEENEVQNIWTDHTPEYAVKEALSYWEV